MPDPIDELASGTAYLFRDWPIQAIPRVAIGLYSVWREQQFVYIGVAGRALTPELVTQHSNDGGRPRGLFDRLKSHASGRRSGDQFCVYVADRLVLPSLSQAEIRAIANGEASLDQLTRSFVHDHLSFRFAQTETFRAAFELERSIQRGEFPAGQPYLNPTPAA
jgi:hypothetical protein